MGPQCGKLATTKMMLVWQAGHDKDDATTHWSRHQMATEVQVVAIVAHSITLGMSENACHAGYHASHVVLPAAVAHLSAGRVGGC